MSSPGRSGDPHATRVSNADPARDSINELAKISDNLVDGLTAHAEDPVSAPPPVPCAPLMTRPVVAAHEVDRSVPLRTGDVEGVDAMIDALRVDTPNAQATDSNLSATIAELNDVSDDLIDNLRTEPTSDLQALDDNSQPTQPGCDLRETLDELDRLIEPEALPTKPRPIEIAAAAGHDIDEHMDSLFTPPAAVTKVERESVDAGTQSVKPEPLEVAVAADNDATAAEELSVPISIASTTSSPVETPESIDEFDTLDPSPASAGASADQPLASIPEIPIDNVKTGKWWLIAASLLLVGAAEGIWLMFWSGSDNDSSVQSAGLGPSRPAAVEPNAVTHEPARELSASLAHVGGVNALDEPNAEDAVEEREPVRAASDTSAETLPRTLRRAAEEQRQVPATVTAEKRTTPKPTFAAPAPIERKALNPPTTEQHLSALAPIEEALSDWQPTAVAMLVEPTVTDIQPPPAPVMAEPEPQPFVPPRVIDRQDPPYPARARKKGEQGTVVLGVLVDEHGRVVRVVIEQGIAGSGLEGAAIDAVLRWSYEPATENGETVRAWIKERFTFEP